MGDILWGRGVGYCFSGESVGRVGGRLWADKWEVVGGYGIGWGRGVSSTTLKWGRGGRLWPHVAAVRVWPHSEAGGEGWVGIGSACIVKDTNSAPVKVRR
jgi:hypothetical protein